MNKTLQIVVLIFITIFITAGIIYATPLKHKNIIEPSVHDVLSEDFYARYIENPDEYVFIDVRGVDQYKEVHVEGSVNMPLHTLYDQRKNLPKNGKTIVIICSGGRASGVAYGYLEHYGFLNLERIEGGVAAWVTAGLPTVSE
ncbi:MAG: rhodanese-like domain-containing protein [Candidatus Paceibacterota bacterium]